MMAELAIAAAVVVLLAAGFAWGVISLARAADREHKARHAAELDALGRMHGRLSHPAGGKHRR